MTAAARPADAPGARRATRQGARILEALGGSPTFRSAQELHHQLRTSGHPVGLTTVYRHLQLLDDAAEVDVLRLGNGETLYRRCAGGHHHHLVCRRCGATVEIEGPEVERWAARVAAAERFTDVDHVVEIIGTCSACAGKKRPLASRPAGARRRRATSRRAPRS